MALDIYWRNYQTETRLGSVEIDTLLEDLLDAFGQQVGFPVDPYGKARLYPAQWQRLIDLAGGTGYPVHQLRQIQAAIPANEPQGLIILAGD